MDKRCLCNTLIYSILPPEKNCLPFKQTPESYSYKFF